MKRCMGVKYCLGRNKTGDAVIVFGEDLCKEFYQYDSEHILYIPQDIEQPAALAAGVAMVNPRNVFFVCEDYNMLKNLPAIAQIGASKLRNFFMVVFITSTYQSVDNMPNIFNSLTKPKSILFDFGFTTHDYSRSYETADGARSTVKSLNGARGPLSIFIKVDQGLKELDSIDFDLKANLKRFTEFLATSEEN
jgi:hypothetical protein